MGIVDYIFLGLILAIVTLLVLKVKPTEDKKDINVHVHTDNNGGTVKANSSDPTATSSGTRPKEIPIEIPKKETRNWLDIEPTDSTLNKN